MNICCVFSIFSRRKSLQIWRPTIPLSLWSHTCLAPRESSNFYLSVPQIKVMWRLCCQTDWPIFSLSVECFPFSYFVPDSFSRSLWLPLTLSTCMIFFLFLSIISTLLFFPGQVEGDIESACGQLSTCVHQWVVCYADPVLGTCCSDCCQCPAFAHSLPPDGGGGGHAEGQKADLGLLCVLCCTGPEI